MSEPRKWLYGLTADEWLHLAAEGEDSEVVPCCAVISDLREALNWLAICQDHDHVWARIGGKEVLERYEIALGYHDALAEVPLLQRVLEGIRRDKP